MHYRRLLLFLIVTANLVCGISALGLNATVAGSDERDAIGAEVISADAKAAACAHTLEQFVSALDKVFTENPKSIVQYFAVLSKYLFFKNGIPDLPPPTADASVDGCRIDEVIQIAKRSKFFYETDGPPRYRNYIVEFRNNAAKVGFAVERGTGNIVGPRAIWIAVYP